MTIETYSKKILGWCLKIFIITLLTWYAHQWWTETMTCYPKSDIPPQENEHLHMGKLRFPVASNNKVWF